MGSIVSRSMEDGLKKNWENVTELNKVTVERQLHSQNQIRERLLAMQIARARELLLWTSVTCGVSVTGFMWTFLTTRKPGYLVPVFPITMILGYQWDLAYGSKMHRIRAEAEHIMLHESDSLQLPFGVPTVSSIDQARQLDSEQQKLHPRLPVL